MINEWQTKEDLKDNVFEELKDKMIDVLKKILEYETEEVEKKLNDVKKMGEIFAISEKKSNFENKEENK